VAGGPPPPPPRPPRRWRWRPLIWGALALVALAGGYASWQWQRGNSAERYFQEGLRAQFASEANLESARNRYLSALELRPRHARTHYYLGHVYAQMQLSGDARRSFQAAVKLARGLDAGQDRDARRQLAALNVADEPAPLSRSAPPAPSGANGGQPAAEAPLAPTPAITMAPPGAIPAPVTPTAARRLFALPPGAGVVWLGGLPHVPAEGDRLGRVESLVARIFAPDGETRITATTSLVVDPELVSDAAPLALRRAIDAQGTSRAGDGRLAAARAGVINTLVLLRAASPATLRKQEGEIRRLLEMARPNGPQTVELVDQVAERLETATKLAPVVWIQIAGEAQRRLAERLAQHLRQAGCDAPGIENVGARAPARQSEIRAQGNSDQGLARWQSLVMGTVDGLRPDLRVLRKARPRVDSYEIWFDRQTCVTRTLPECD
jgi:hypothetical protein